jgi:hypothetical protein
LPLTPSFSASQPAGAPASVTITDTSSGSDGTLTSRRIYFQKADGTYLVPEGTETDYVEWDIDETSVTVEDLLDSEGDGKDYALNITVNWMTNSTVSYEADDPWGFQQYNDNFDYTLTQLLSQNPLLQNDNNFWESKSLLRTYIDSGSQAVSVGDIFSAQICYDKATLLRTNSQYVFNANS